MVEKYVSQGYTAIKLGWGPLGYNVHFDLDLIKTARKEAGDNVELMIDIGKRYRLKSAMYVAKALEQLNVYWLEEPLPAEDYIGYKKLTESTTMLSHRRRGGRLAFARLINETHIDVVQPDGHVAASIEAKNCKKSADKIFYCAAF
jgi:L-alanine-DL-glutamate epimerase-like enolase superfamily enzyme